MTAIPRRVDNNLRESYAAGVFTKDIGGTATDFQGVVIVDEDGNPTGTTASPSAVRLYDANGNAIVSLPSGAGTRNALEALVNAGHALVTSSSLNSGSTTTVINTASDLSAYVFRGDLAYVTPLLSFAWLPSGAYVEVLSVNSSSVTLASPLPFTPTASGQIQIYRRVPLPLSYDGVSSAPRLGVEGTFAFNASSFYEGLTIDPVYYGVGALGSDYTGTYRALKINSNGQTETRLYDSSGNAIASATTTPAGTERGLITRNIPSGTQAVSGTVAATQSGTWSVRLQDGSGNGTVSAIVNPTESQRGLIVRNLDAAHAYGSAATRYVNGTLPQGYYLSTTRVTGVGSTTTVVVVTVDASTVARKGDILLQTGGTFAQGVQQWAVIESVSSVNITLQAPGFGIAPANGLTVAIYRPRPLSLTSSGHLEVAAGAPFSTTPVSGNKTFWESGSVAFGGIANSLTTFYTNSAKGYLIDLANTTDVELGYSLDGGTSEHFIPADSTVQWNLMDIGGDLDAGTDIQVYYPAAAPTRGRFSFALAYY